jgi:hypothetical protein
MQQQYSASDIHHSDLIFLSVQSWCLATYFPHSLDRSSNHPALVKSRICGTNIIDSRNCSHRLVCILCTQWGSTTGNAATVAHSRKRKQSGKDSVIEGQPLLLFIRVFSDLIDDFTKSDFKSFWGDFAIFKIILKYGDLI